MYYRKIQRCVDPLRRAAKDTPPSPGRITAFTTKENKAILPIRPDPSGIKSDSTDCSNNFPGWRSYCQNNTGDGLSADRENWAARSIA